MAESKAAFQIKFLRGSAEANNSYTGPVGELSIDLTNWRVRIHDGVTAGGHALTNLGDLEVVEQTIADLKVADIQGLENYSNTSDMQQKIDAAVQVLRQDVNERKAKLAGSTTQDFATKKLTVAGTILPEGIDQDIGSPEARFRGIYVDEAYLSTNTLYIGDTPIMGTDEDTIMIKADPDQSITVKTSGSGTTTVQSDKEVSVLSRGMNGGIGITAEGSGSKIRAAAEQSIDLTAPEVRVYGDSIIDTNQSVGGNLSVAGNLSVTGDVISVDTERVEVSDNLLLLNNGETGSGVTAGSAGIEIDRGSLSSYQFVYDETDDMFKVGMKEDLEVVATREWVAAEYAAKDHSHDSATKSVGGFMSAGDKTKLDGVEKGAQKNVAPTKTVIDELGVNASTVNDLTVETAVPKDALFTDTVYDDNDVREQLGEKVAKVAGKGLSTNDFTDDAEAKLTGIEEGAEVNVVTSVAGKEGDVTLNKSDVGLGSVDNTSDTDKPVSAAQQSALDEKVSVSDIVDDLVSGLVTDKPLSAAQGAVLKGHIDNINALLSSDDTTLDELQELVDYIKVNRDSFENLGVSNIAGLQSALDGKVDKVAGKGLSTEDFTSSEKQKLSGVESGAQVNVATNLSIGGSGNTRHVNSSTGSNVTLPLASTSNAGLMSTGDKTKLDDVEKGAQKNIPVTKVSVDALDVDAATVNGLTVETAVPTGAVFTDTVYDDADLVSQVEGKVAKSAINNTLTSVEPTEVLAATQGKELKDHVDNINTVLQSDDSTLDELQEIVDYIKTNRNDLSSLGVSNISGLERQLGDKVDVVAGKTLTTNDLTDILKSKLDGVEAGAQKNVGEEFDSAGNYAQLRARATTQSDVGLGQVRNVKTYSQSEANERFVQKTDDVSVSKLTGNIDLGHLPAV